MNIKSKIDSLKDIKMKQIKQDIKINKGAMNTHVKLDLNGKTIMDEPGHSILAGYAQELYLAMRSETDTLTTLPEKLNGSTSLLTFWFTSAETYSSGTKVKLNYKNGYTEYINAADYDVYIYGTGTLLDGNVYAINAGDASSNYIVIDTAWSAGYSAITNGYGLHLLRTPTNIFPFLNSPQTMYVRYGYNATAVAITDDKPQIAPELTYGATTYSVVTPDADNDRVDLIFTMTATNGTINTVTVSDVNMLRYDTTNATFYLFARDVLTSPVSIPPGGSLTITYTIRTTTDLASDNTGGFTRRFLEMLRGTIVATNVLDVQNTSRATNVGGAASGYPMYRALALSRNYPQSNSHVGNSTGMWKFGIILGTGTDEPDLSDYYMATAIEDGSGSGQLKYWASSVEGYTETSTTRSFDVSRIVQNSSGGAIVVSEIGLGVCISGGDNYLNFSALIARHVLSAADPDNRITIADGEFCIITYTITIEV